MASSSVLTSIDAVVKSGRTVISCDSSTIVRMVQEAVQNDATLAFYVPRSQFEDIMQKLWTPQRIKEVGMEPVSKQELDKIESELEVASGVNNLFKRLQCPCGEVYGAFEFVQQGVREHGKDWVKGVFGFENASVIRVNPATIPICPKCTQPINAKARYWWWPVYGCDGSD